MKLVKTRLKGSRAGVGFLVGSRESPLHQLWDLGSPGKSGFWSNFGPQKSRPNGQLAFESEGSTSESGGHVRM